MTSKLHRTRRLLAVQKQRDRMSEWRLLELLSHSASLDERHRNLLRFLQQESAFTGMFSLSVLHRLQSLAELRAAADTEQYAQRTQHFNERSCLRRAERIVQALEAGEIRKDTARELEETIDSRAKQGSQGPGKLPRRPYQT